MAGRPRDRLVVDAGAVRRAERRRGGRSQIPESNVRVIVPLLGGGFGSKCDFHFEGHVAALARAAGPAGEAGLHARGGVRRPGSPSRGDGDRARERRASRRDDRRPPRQARARRRRLLRRGRLLRPDRGDACLWSVRARERGRLVDARLHEQPTVRLDPRADGAAGLLGSRAAHGRAGRGPRARPGRAAPAHARSRTAPSARPGRSSASWDQADARARRRADRLRTASCGEDEAIGVACGWWPSLRRRLGRVREAERRRHRHDRHRRAGERQRRRDGAAAPRRRGARHAARRLLDPLPGHRRRPVGHGLVRVADDLQQRPRRRRGRPRGA